MNKKYLLVLLLTILFWSWSAQAQTIVTIGDDNQTAQATTNTPFNVIYNYSFVEQIYTAQEIQDNGGSAGFITAVSFYHRPSANVPSQSTNIVLYMKSIGTKAVFTGPNNGSTDVVSVSESDVVYRGSWLVPAGEGWVTINLTTPFEYDGTNNLLIALDKNNRNCIDNGKSLFTCTAKNASVHAYYSDDANPNPYNIGAFPSGSFNFNILSRFRANIQLTLSEDGNTCMKPSTFDYADVAAHSATLIWGEGSGLYNVEYKKASDSNWISALTETTSLTITLTGLDDDTDYQARVQSVCNGDATSKWTTLDFRTTCGSVTTFPWSEDFDDLREDDIPSCWDNSDGTTEHEYEGINTNQYWCYADGYTGASGDIFGSTNNTGHNNTGCVRFDSFIQPLDRTNFLKTVVFDFPEHSLMQLSFWYRNPTGGDFSVYISTDGGETYETPIATNLPNQTEWTEQTIVLNGYEGTQNVVIVFKGTSNNGSGDAFIYLDDVSVSVKPATFTKDIVAYTDDRDFYYLIASPIGQVNSMQVTYLIGNEYDFYAYDPNQDNEWRNYKQEQFDLVPGRGYLYANSEDVTLQFTGEAYHGTGEVILSKASDAYYAGWNLVGNPFGETAYIDRDFYVMNDEGCEIIASPRSRIEVMEGVFVKANYDGERMTFRTKPRSQQHQMLALNLSKGASKATVIDRAIVNFDESPMLPKLQISQNSPKLCFVMDGNDYAAICCESMGTLPVSFQPASNGTYTLSISIENIELGYLHLIDTITGTDIDLLQTPSYSFEACTTDRTSRFKLVFATKAVDSPESCH